MIVLYEALENATVDSLPALLAWVSQMTNYTYGYVLILTTFIVFFISMKVYRSEDAFTYAAFLTTTVTFFLGVMNIVPYMVILVPILVTAISAALPRK